MQEDEEDEEEEIHWLDDIDDEEIAWQDDTDSGTRGVVNSKNKNRRRVEDEVEVHPWKKRGDVEGTREKRGTTSSNKNKNKAVVTRKRKLPFTQEDELTAKDNHKVLLEEAVHNLRQQQHLFVDDHLIAVLWSILPEHLMFLSSKVCKS